MENKDERLLKIDNDGKIIGFVYNTHMNKLEKISTDIRNAETIEDSIKILADFTHKYAREYRMGLHTGY